MVRCVCLSVCRTLTFELNDLSIDMAMFEGQGQKFKVRKKTVATVNGTNLNGDFLHCVSKKFPPFNCL